MGSVQYDTIEWHPHFYNVSKLWLEFDGRNSVFNGNSKKRLTGQFKSKTEFYSLHIIATKNLVVPLTLYFK